MIASEIRTASAGLVAIGDQASLERIDQANVSLCIWRRRLAAGIAADASSLLAAPFETRCIVRESTVGRPAFEAPPIVGARIAAAPCLLDDAAMLVALFMRLARVSASRLRLECLHDDGCALFHTENVRLRLTTTYAGVGLQWVKPDYNAAAKRDQREYRGPIEQVSIGDIALLKGLRATRAPILHRSPPIRVSGPRLILVIDAVDQMTMSGPGPEPAPFSSDRRSR